MLSGAGPWVLIVSDTENVMYGTVRAETLTRYPELMLHVSLCVAIWGNEWLIVWLWRDSCASGWVSNGVYIDRWLERMNNWEVRLMECVEDLRTQLCGEEHKECDWHGAIWQRLMGGW